VDVSYVFAGLPVADRDGAADWYARLIGRPADMLPNDAEAAWQLTESASLYLVTDPVKAGRGVVTLVVADLRAERAKIAASGIEAGPVEAVGQAGLKCVVPDPDGNSVALIELYEASSRVGSE